MDSATLFSSKASKHFTDEQKWAIVISLKYFGLKQYEVAEKFGACKVTVSRIWSKYSKENTLKNNYQNCGSKHKFSPGRVEKVIDEAIQENRKINSSNLKRKLEEDDNIRYRSPTIGKLRKVLGYVGRRPSEKPHLTDTKREARKKYCRDHAKDKFTNVLFIDESVVQMNENKEIVWYKPNEEPRPVFEQHQTNHKYMIAGGISSKGKTSLKVWDISKKKKKDEEKETVNGKEYKKFLIQAFAETSISIGREHFRVQHDNARPHISKEVTNYINNKGIKLIPQPASSPDLQPIEKVWNFLKTYISSYKPENKNDLLTATQEA